MKNKIIKERINNYSVLNILNYNINNNLNKYLSEIILNDINIIINNKEYKIKNLRDIENINYDFENIVYNKLCFNFWVDEIIEQFKKDIIEKEISNLEHFILNKNDK